MSSTSKSSTWKLVLQLIVAALSAIATTLGVTSCMGVNQYVWRVGKLNVMRYRNDTTEMKREWRHGVAPFYDDVLLSRLLFLAVFLYYSVCFADHGDRFLGSFPLRKRCTHPAPIFGFNPKTSVIYPYFIYIKSFHYVVLLFIYWNNYAIFQWWFLCFPIL